jgi:formamidopyrimidine-DNA glycosylase
MPELPEVQTIVDELNAADMVGKKILAADVFWHKTLACPDLVTFQAQIVNQAIRQIYRRGKFIVFKLTDYTLLVHLRMTGQFSISSNNGKKVLKHERLRLLLNDQRLLCYVDQRKFGKWELLKDPYQRLSELGIEPLSEQFTLVVFKQLVEAARGQVKPFLLNQHFVAGLGNIYVDEALWLAKIHPQRLVHTLNQKEIAALHRVIPLVLNTGLANKGTSLGTKRDNYATLHGKRGSNQQQLNVFRREDQPCPRCSTHIRRIVVAQRGTHLCDTCQKI